MKLKRLFLALVSVLSVVLAGDKLTAFDKAGVARNVSVSVDSDIGNHI
jgi:hypothetical protein